MPRISKLLIASGRWRLPVTLRCHRPRCFVDEVLRSTLREIVEAPKFNPSYRAHIVMRPHALLAASMNVIGASAQRLF